jgi:hypothetical protein
MPQLELADGYSHTTALCCEFVGLIHVDAEQPREIRVRHATAISYSLCKVHAVGGLKVPLWRFLRSGVPDEKHKASMAAPNSVAESNAGPVLSLRGGAAGGNCERAETSTELWSPRLVQ